MTAGMPAAVGVPVPQVPQTPLGVPSVDLRRWAARRYSDRPMSAATSGTDSGVTPDAESEVRTMNPLLAELQAQLEARDDRLEAAGPTPARHPWRSSLEIMRDVRRRREQERGAA